MCDTLVLVQPGRVLFAKNSDRDPNEAQLLQWVPAQEHPAGARLRCTWITIPQVRRTHAVLLSRPYWIWGAEMGTNEHGVTIGNEAVFTHQPLARRGLTGMDLLRLALERARSATQAAEVITNLIRRHGQGGGCGHEHRRFSYHNSFLIADPRGALVLETAGDHTALERVRSARSISNALTIEHFAARHARRLHGAVARAATRQQQTQLAAQTARGPLDLAAALRSHGPATGAPRYSLLSGGLGAPCVHAGGLLTASQTTGSWIAELTPAGVRHWVTATAAPCTSLFKPVDLRQPLELGQPTDRADPRSLWWRHEALHRRVLRDPAACLPLFAAERDALEQRWFHTPPEPQQAFVEGDALLADWTARVRSLRPRDRRPWVVRRHWQRRNRRGGLRL